MKLWDQGGIICWRPVSSLSTTIWHCGAGLICSVRSRWHRASWQQTGWDIVPVPGPVTFPGIHRPASSSGC
uniref:Putative secreted protein n=1 Tax=Anopheles darlingi TaxID=43151 RepID=A0A2M4DJZ0_ANODA